MPVSIRLSQTIFSRIMNFESPKEAWEKLRKEFDGGNRSRKIKLLRLKCEFEMLRMQETETIKHYASKLSDTVNKIKLLGDKFPDSRVVEKILVSLPPKFESKISALEELADIETITTVDLINKLQSQEQRVSMYERSSTEGALFSSLVENTSGTHKYNKKNIVTQKKDSPCKIYSLTNHPESECWYKRKKVIRCNICKKLGHKEKFYRQKQRQEGIHHSTNPKQEPQQANITEEHCEQTGVLLVASSETLEDDDILWIVDSRCTSHMCRSEKMFQKLDNSIKGKVRLGDGNEVSIEGKWCIAVKTKGENKFITDVHFVHSLTQNPLCKSDDKQQLPSLL